MNNHSETGNFIGAYPSLGSFSTYIYGLLLLESSEYAMGEDGSLLMPENEELDGSYNPVFINKGKYG